MGAPIVLIADAGKDAGLGHISRSTGLAVALRSLGAETQCYAYGQQEPLRHDGVEWTPLPTPDLPAAHVLVIDSYRLPHEALAGAARITRLVVMHDFGGVPAGAALVVSAADAPSTDSHRLGGFAYTPLRPAFWGLPQRELGSAVGHILVTTGGGQFSELGEAIARALVPRMPDSKVSVIAGPYGKIAWADGIDVLDAPASLMGPLLDADLVVTAAGQTMLEAAAAGTPCVALPLVENQRRQAARLAERGGVRLVDPPSVEGALVAVAELARSVEARRAISREGQRAIDGYGALRVAFAITRLAGEAS